MFQLQSRFIDGAAHDASSQASYIKTNTTVNDFGMGALSTSERLMHRDEVLVLRARAERNPLAAGTINSRPRTPCRCQPPPLILLSRGNIGTAVSGVLDLRHCSCVQKAPLRGRLCGWYGRDSGGCILCSCGAGSDSSAVAEHVFACADNASISTTCETKKELRQQIRSQQVSGVRHLTQKV